MEKERERLRKKIASTGSGKKLAAPKPKKQHKPGDFKLGESVRVLSLNLNGTVTSLPDAKGNVNVQMGILNSQVNISDLEIIEEQPVYTAAKNLRRTSQGKMKMGKSLSVSPEINLLGKTVDEAVAELDKYLDDATWPTSARCASSTERAQALSATASTSTCAGRSTSRTSTWLPSARAMQVSPLWNSNRQGGYLW